MNGTHDTWMVWVGGTVDTIACLQAPQAGLAIP